LRAGPGEDVRLKITVSIYGEELTAEMSSKEVDARGARDKAWREKVQKSWRDWIRALLEDVIGVIQSAHPDWRLSEVAERLNTHNLMMSSILSETRPLTVDRMMDLLDELDARVDVEVDTVGTHTFQSKKSSA